MSAWQAFDRQVREFEGDIQKLERLIATPGISEERRAAVKEQIDELRKRQEALTRTVFARLTPWDNVLLARHVYRSWITWGLPGWTTSTTSSTISSSCTATGASATIPRWWPV